MVLGKKVAILGLGMGPKLNSAPREGQKIPCRLNQYKADSVSITQDYNKVPLVSLELATHQSQV